MEPLNLFLSGAFMMASLAIALFFVRYWRQSHERLFAILALAFFLFAFERTVLALVPPSLDGRHYIFVARLLAFVLIIAGIVDKNRPRRRNSERNTDSRPPSTAGETQSDASAPH